MLAVTVEVYRHKKKTTQHIAQNHSRGEKIVLCLVPTFFCSLFLCVRAEKFQWATNIMLSRGDEKEEKSFCFFFLLYNPTPSTRRRFNCLGKRSERTEYISLPFLCAHSRVEMMVSTWECYSFYALECSCNLKCNSLFAFLYHMILKLLR